MEVLSEFEKYLKEIYSNDGEHNTIKAYMSDIKQFIQFFDDHFRRGNSRFFNSSYN